MERIVSSVMRFFQSVDAPRTEIHVNRIAMGGSHDRALAAFKADQARIASKQDGATFASKRGGKK
ncbi:hypothetical protein HKCCE4037_12830 [Rhodobacterales bacterium HKCCE4037]|nr:hypothetical protein [Rhodobacterales bacterium HKCCE4037]